VSHGAEPHGAPDVHGAAAEAYAHLETIRWPQGPRCPHCGAGGAYFLQPSAGAARRTRTGASTARRVWKCAACRRQFSVLTGTIWHRTRIDIPTWLSIVNRCAHAAAVPSIRELTDEWQLSTEAARRIRRLLGPAVERVGAAGPADRLVEALLQIDGEDARRLRRAAGRHARPLRQAGPSADYGPR
jgi:hypothetical protein